MQPLVASAAVGGGMLTVLQAAGAARQARLCTGGARGTAARRRDGVTSSSNFRAKAQPLRARRAFPGSGPANPFTPASASAEVKQQHPLYETSPRVTRRHVGPRESNPASRLHGMSAAESEAEYNTQAHAGGSAHLTHTSDDRRRALLAGQRLQPKSNPHINKLLRDHLAAPLPSRYDKLCAEFRRGPVYVMVSEHEMALRENEVQMAALRHVESDAALPLTMAFHPLLFLERDSDSLEDGDALMVKRTTGTLAPEYSYKRNSSYVSIFTDVESLEAAVKHPQLQASGVDRVSYIGLTPTSLAGWVQQEAIDSDLVIYLNRWTPLETRLTREDLQDLFTAGPQPPLQAAAGSLADDFASPRLEGEGDGVKETWNTMQDRRGAYIEARRQMLRERREAARGGTPPHLLAAPAAEQRTLDALAESVTGEPAQGSTPSASTPAGEPALTTLGDVSPGDVVPIASPALRVARLVLSAVLLQRPEVSEAYLVARVGGVAGGEDPHRGSLVLSLRTADFALTCGKLAAVMRYFESEGEAFPHVSYVQISADGGAGAVAGRGERIYTRPKKLHRMGRAHPSG